MAREGIAPNHIRVLFKVCAQDDFNPGIIDCHSINRLNQNARIFETHLPEFPGATSVAVEGDTPKKGTALFIDVEVGKNTVILQAEAEATRPRWHLREFSD